MGNGARSLGAMSGQDGSAAKNAAQTAAGQAETVGDQKHTLDTYVNQVGK